MGNGIRKGKTREVGEEAMSERNRLKFTDEFERISINQGKIKAS